MLPLIDEIQQKFNFLSVIPISALSKNNLDVLTNEIEKALPEGPFHFPEKSEDRVFGKFFISEIIRERLLTA